MPPRASQSTQAGPSQIPVLVVIPVTPTPSPAPETISARSNESLTPAPDTPRKAPKAVDNLPPVPEVRPFKANTPSTPHIKESSLSTPPMPSPGTPFREEDEEAWKDKTPALAYREFETPGGFSYSVCIDSGSSISVMDHDFALEHLPQL